MHRHRLARGTLIAASAGLLLLALSTPAAAQQWDEEPEYYDPCEEYIGQGAVEDVCREKAAEQTEQNRRFLNFYWGAVVVGFGLFIWHQESKEKAARDRQAEQADREWRRRAHERNAELDRERLLAEARAAEEEAEANELKRLLAEARAAEAEADAEEAAQFAASGRRVDRLLGVGSRVSDLAARCGLSADDAELLADEAAEMFVEGVSPRWAALPAADYLDRAELAWQVDAGAVFSLYLLLGGPATPERASSTASVLRALTQDVDVDRMAWIGAIPEPEVLEAAVASVLSR